MGFQTSPTLVNQLQSLMLIDLSFLKTSSVFLSEFEWDKIFLKIIYSLYMESRKIVLISLFSEQQWRCTQRKQTWGWNGGKERVGRIGRVALKRVLYSTICKTDSQWGFAGWYRNLFFLMLFPMFRMYYFFSVSNQNLRYTNSETLVWNTKDVLNTLFQGYLVKKFILEIKNTFRLQDGK